MDNNENSGIPFRLIVSIAVSTGIVVLAIFLLK
jgi:hypothetical protein